MIKYEQITVAVTYCDFCGDRCGHSVHAETIAGQTYHACRRLDEHDNLVCIAAARLKGAQPRRGHGGPALAPLGTES